MDAVLHHTIRLQCSPHRAFEMFTVNPLVEQWFPVDADIEPVVGGKFELFWDPDHKEENSTLGCHVTAVVPDRLLAFEWKGPVRYQGFMNAPDALTHVVVAFFPCGDEPGCCEVHVIHSGWRDAPEWQAARRFFAHAWEGELLELKKVVERRP
jgi:uncharacterized protein YndB with AHSA1/START domain